jgi:hypothetical protein
MFAHNSSVIVTYPNLFNLIIYWQIYWMRHEVARMVVCYGYIVNKPAVPSAESIGTGVAGNGWVGSCRDNVPHHPGAETTARLFP